MEARASGMAATTGGHTPRSNQHLPTDRITAPWRQRNVIDSASVGRRHAFLSLSQEKMLNPPLIQYPHTLPALEAVERIFPKNLKDFSEVAHIG